MTTFTFRVIMYILSYNLNKCEEYYELFRCYNYFSIFSITLYDVSNNCLFFFSLKTKIICDYCLDYSKYGRS